MSAAEDSRGGQAMMAPWIRFVPWSVARPAVSSGGVRQFRLTDGGGIKPPLPVAGWRVQMQRSRRELAQRLGLTP